MPLNLSSQAITNLQTVKDTNHIIHTLTESSPAEQQACILKYFTPNASFRHIICRVQHFDNLHLPFLGELNSRWVIQQIYLWYKTLSPTVRVEIQSTVYDQKSQMVYISMHQYFSLFFERPFGYVGKIPLVTVLHLKKDDITDRFYIHSQEDHYQPEEFLKFFLPGGHYLVEWWQGFNAIACVVGALLLTPWLRVLIWLTGIKVD